MKTILLDFKLHQTSLSDIVNQIQNGGIGIFPTDTVYGLGCSAFNEEAINLLFQYKKRAYTKPISVLISNLEMLHLLVEEISPEEQKLIDTFWPGPLTIVFRKKNTVSNLLTSHLDTIAIRMPNDKIALDLLNLSNLPLATTSVNLSGKDASIKIDDVDKSFLHKVNFIIDNGISKIKKASTIVQMINKNPSILREGSITKKQIIKALE